MAEAPKVLPFREIGSTGLNLQAGMAFEEFMPTLQGINGVKAYQEMSLNSPIVGAILFVIEQMIGQVEWNVKPFSEEEKDKPAADFVNECLHDMSFSWADTLSEIITFLTYGWSYLEVTYKYRKGEQPGPPIPIVTDPKTRDIYTGLGVRTTDPANTPITVTDDFASSKFTDGKVGWRKWSLRGQNTLVRWVYDTKGGIQGMTQQVDWPVFAEKTIPISKSLLFRTSVEKNNPEGRSILRRAYRPWWYSKRLEESEAIGLERDLNGFPVLKPPESISPYLWSDDPIMSQSLSHAERFIQKLRRGEKEGAVLPFGWELELLSSGSRRAIDINTTITRYETRIAMTCAADFLMLGQSNVGSWALSTDKTEMFTLALGGYLKRIKEVINRHAIPPLLRFNNFDSSRPPSIEHGDIETQNLTEMAQYLSALTTAGAVTFPNETLSRYLMTLAKWPEDAVEDMPPLPPEEGEPEELTSEKRKWLKKSLGELREIMLAHKNGKANGHANGGFFLTDDREDAIILDKAFCPTGQGGGVDPSCSPGGGSGGSAGTSGEGGRAARAKASHVRMDKEKRGKAAKHEATVAKAVGGRDLPDNEPFDVIRGSHAIEVKAIIAGKVPKITVHPDSHARKLKYARKNKMTSHMVAIDARSDTPKYYYKKGVGSYRLNSMRQVSLSELRGIFK